MRFKKCFKCGAEKPLTEFYKHRKMSDGHLNKCKECTKKDTTKNRWDNISEKREYDRERGNRQDPEYLKSWRNKFPVKYKAHNALNNALRDGKIEKSPCEICGNESQSHTMTTITNPYQLEGYAKHTISNGIEITERD